MYPRVVQHQPIAEDVGQTPMPCWLHMVSVSQVASRRGGNESGMMNSFAAFTAIPFPLLAVRRVVAAVTCELAGTDNVIRKVAPDGASVSTVALPASSAVTALAVDAAGTLYYGGYGGLMRLLPGGTPSVLVPRGVSVVLGSQPTVSDIDSIAVLAPGQLVVLSSGQILRVTLH